MPLVEARMVADHGSEQASDCEAKLVLGFLICGLINPEVGVAEIGS